MLTLPDFLKNRRALAAIVIGFCLALIFVTVFSPRKAHADGPTPMVYFGVHGGKSMANTEVTVDGVPFSLDGLGATGYVGGVHGGVDMALTSGNALAPFIGTFGGYSWQNTEFSVTMGSSNFSATLGDTFYGGGRVGLMWHGGAKAYGLVAYRQTDLKFSESNLSSPALRGWDLGMGVTFPIAKSVSFGVEGVWTKYDKEELKWGGAPTGVNIETDQLSVVGRINIELGNAPQSIFDDGPAPVSKACDPKIGNCKK
jgi:hypothetical protein